MSSGNDLETGTDNFFSSYYLFAPNYTLDITFNIPSITSYTWCAVLLVGSGGSGGNEGSNNGGCGGCGGGAILSFINIENGYSIKTNIYNGGQQTNNNPSVNGVNGTASSLTLYSSSSVEYVQLYALGGLGGVTGSSSTDNVNNYSVTGAFIESSSYTNITSYPYINCFMVYPGGVGSISSTNSSSNQFFYMNYLSNLSGIPGLSITGNTFLNVMTSQSGTIYNNNLQYGYTNISGGGGGGGNTTTYGTVCAPNSGAGNGDPQQTATNFDSVFIGGGGGGASVEQVTGWNGSPGFCCITYPTQQLSSNPNYNSSSTIFTPLVPLSVDATSLCVPYPNTNTGYGAYIMASPYVLGTATPPGNSPNPPNNSTLTTTYNYLSYMTDLSNDIGGPNTSLQFPYTYFNNVYNSQDNTTSNTFWNTHSVFIVPPPTVSTNVTFFISGSGGSGACGNTSVPQGSGNPNNIYGGAGGNAADSLLITLTLKPDDLCLVYVGHGVSNVEGTYSYGTCGAPSFIVLNGVVVGIALGGYGNNNTYISSSNNITIPFSASYSNSTYNTYVNNLYSVLTHGTTGSIEFSSGTPNNGTDLNPYSSRIISSTVFNGAVGGLGSQNVNNSGDNFNYTEYNSYAYLSGTNIPFTTDIIPLPVSGAGGGATSNSGSNGSSSPESGSSGGDGISVALEDTSSNIFNCQIQDGGSGVDNYLDSQAALVNIPLINYTSTTSYYTINTTNIGYKQGDTCNVMFYGSGGSGSAAGYFSGVQTPISDTFSPGTPGTGAPSTGGICIMWYQT